MPCGCGNVLRRVRGFGSDGVECGFCLVRGLLWSGCVVGASTVATDALVRSGLRGFSGVALGSGRVGVRPVSSTVSVEGFASSPVVDRGGGLYLVSAVMSEL